MMLGMVSETGKKAERARVPELAVLLDIMTRCWN